MLALAGLSLAAYSQVPGNGNKQDAKAKAAKRSAPSPPPTVTCICANSEKDAKQEQKSSPEKSVGYQWIEFLAPANVPTGLLVLVGIGGIIVAVSTLLTVKRQVDTFVSKERGRIAVEIEPIKQSGAAGGGTPYPNSNMPPPSGEVWYANLLISNSGETNALIGHALCKACIKSNGWDPGSETIRSRIGLPKVLHPHQNPFPHKVMIETGNVLSLEVDRKMAQAIADGQMGVYVIGLIEFGDVFDNRWSVTFCRKWGAWWFGGAWQGPDIWYDYPEKSRFNGEFRIKRPSYLRKLWRKIRKEDSDFPVIEISD
jgi:hypothetical protein